MQKLCSKKGIIFFLTIFLVFLFPHIPVVRAVDLQSQIIEQQLGGAAVKAEVGAPVDPRVAVASLIKVALTILGTVFFVLMVMSGYWFVTARGNEDKEEKAKDTIRSAVIGLAIVLMAYAITIFVSSRLIVATSPVTPTESRGGLGTSFVNLIGSWF